MCMLTNVSDTRTMKYSVERDSVDIAELEKKVLLRVNQNFIGLILERGIWIIWIDRAS